MRGGRALPITKLQYPFIFNKQHCFLAHVHISHPVQNRFFLIRSESSDSRIGTWHDEDEHFNIHETRSLSE